MNDKQKTLRQNTLDGTKIGLMNDDMFLSKMQTITIPVNTVGVMGGGLAALAKEKFPRMSIKFQELCRDKQISTKTPFLYKDDNWVLLFATKENWRNPSKIEYIKDGMKWLMDNAAKAGIQSLAMPALGCGLGGLPWEVVGPVMCQNLARPDIPCEIYLPREHRVPDEQLSDKFLLNKSNSLV